MGCGIVDRGHRVTPQATHQQGALGQATLGGGRDVLQLAWGGEAVRGKGRVMAVGGAQGLGQHAGWRLQQRSGKLQQAPGPPWLLRSPSPSKAQAW